MGGISKRSAMVGAVLSIGILAGCYQVPQSTAASNEQGSIAATSQAAGSSIVVSSIGMPTTGWVVVHAAPGGQADVSGSIGHAYVPAGPSSNVRVPLSVTAKPGDQVVAMLHLDTGAPKVYEFANGGLEKLDGPVLKDGKPVMVTITLN